MNFEVFIGKCFYGSEREIGFFHEEPDIILVAGCIYCDLGICQLGIANNQDEEKSK
jgi:hypothetical protein